MHNQQGRSVLDMTCEEAQKYFLKHESYFSNDLPPYYQFQTLLDSVADNLGSCLEKKALTSANSQSNVNYVIIANKDGKLSWRPLEFVHPVLYVNLVKYITKDDNWKKLKKRFQSFPGTDRCNNDFECFSLPVQATGPTEKDKASLVKDWWEKVELQSISLALEFEYLLDTDIAGCYSSIYTHSIAWAVETREVAKSCRKSELLGNYIDWSVQAMQSGQTNGIPQGSTLMDFIAELVLGYIDSELQLRIRDHLDGVRDSKFKIIRYRDDYRIFVNDISLGELILRLLSEVLAENRMSLNSAKTKNSHDVINASIKEDKLSWIIAWKSHKNLLRQSLLIKNHSERHPNSGSLTRALAHFNRQLRNVNKPDVTTEATISVIVDIAHKNPKVYPVCAAIISKYMSIVDDEQKNQISNRIHRKLSQVLSYGYMEIWLQRALLKQTTRPLDYREKLCRIVCEQQDVDLWNSDWLSDKIQLQKTTASTSIILDRTKLNEVGPVIEISEVSLFGY